MEHDLLGFARSTKCERTHNAVNSFWKELAHAGDAQAAKGVANEASTAQAMKSKNLIAGRHEAVNTFGSVERSEGDMGYIQEYHRVCGAGLVGLPQEIQVWHLQQTHGSPLAMS